MVSLGWLGAILFIQNYPLDNLSSPYASQILLIISIIIVWVSMFLVFLQAYIRLRAPDIVPETEDSEKSARESNIVGL